MKTLPFIFVLLEFVMLGQHFFGCDRVEIWSNSFKFDVFMLHSEFHLFSHFEAYGSVLLCMKKICMSSCVLLCLSKSLLNLGSLSKSSWASHITDWNLILYRNCCKRINYLTKTTVWNALVFSYLDMPLPKLSRSKGRRNKLYELIWFFVKRNNAPPNASMCENE